MFCILFVLRSTNFAGFTDIVSTIKFVKAISSDQQLLGGPLSSKRCPGLSVEVYKTMGAAGAKDHRLQMMLETELARVKALKEQYPVIDWHDEVPHFPTITFYPLF